MNKTKIRPWLVEPSIGTKCYVLNFKNLGGFEIIYWSGTSNDRLLFEHHLIYSTYELVQDAITAIMNFTMSLKTPIPYIETDKNLNSETSYIVTLGSGIPYLDNSYFDLNELEYFNKNGLLAETVEDANQLIESILDFLKQKVKALQIGKLSLKQPAEGALFYVPNVCQHKILQFRYDPCNKSHKYFVQNNLAYLYEEDAKLALSVILETLN